MLLVLSGMLPDSFIDYGHTPPSSEKTVLVTQKTAGNMPAAASRMLALPF
jgi:hypothetical protein